MVQGLQLGQSHSHGASATRRRSRGSEGRRRHEDPAMAAGAAWRVQSLFIRRQTPGQPLRGGPSTTPTAPATGPRSDTGLDDVHRAEAMSASPVCRQTPAVSPGQVKYRRCLAHGRPCPLPPKATRPNRGGPRPQTSCSSPRPSSQPSSAAVPRRHNLGL